MADPILVLAHIDETLEIDIGTKEALGFALNVSKQTGSTVECGLIGTDNASAVDAVTVLGATKVYTCLLYTSPSPRDGLLYRMPSSA